MIFKFSKYLWLFVFFVAVFTAVNKVQASAWLTCEVCAKVEEIRVESATSSYALKVRLLGNPYSCDGHSLAMKHAKGQLLLIEVVSKPHSEKIIIGTEIKLKYEAYKVIGPYGLLESEEWSVLEVVK